MIKYKLTNQALQTYKGFQWTLGEKKTIHNPGADMCTGQVFHYYASPEQAVLFNPIHAGIANPRLFEVEIDKEVAWDGLKGGCHEMTLVKELPLPSITTEQRVEFAIRAALTVYRESTFSHWASKWLSGEGRSTESAEAAWKATWAAARAAEAAAWAAEKAAWAAEKAAWAAEKAARAAWAATWAAARAAEAAAEAAEKAARAAAADGRYVDFQPIIEEVLNK